MAQAGSVTIICRMRRGTRVFGGESILRRLRISKQKKLALCVSARRDKNSVPLCSAKRKLSIADNVQEVEAFQFQLNTEFHPGVCVIFGTEKGRHCTMRLSPSIF